MDSIIDYTYAFKLRIQVEIFECSAQMCLLFGENSSFIEKNKIIKINTVKYVIVFNLCNELVINIAIHTRYYFKNGPAFVFIFIKVVAQDTIKTKITL